ncbi:MAG: hypothetical protein FWG98_00975 [Candidatus Cloacimonetes bacterium]|nr:hypothetical protein [Candidatus Cloacimonadota bacterium]
MKKKHYIPAVFIIVAILLSAYYVFFRDNEIEIQLDRSRYIINQRIRNIELERFPLRLQLEFERLRRDFTNIQLQKEWTTELTFDLTHPPFFDLRNLYLVSFDKLAVYNKNDLNSVWVKQLDFDIESFSLIDGNNILVIDSNGSAYALNRNTGDLNWSQSIHERYISEHSFSIKPILITHNEDKRIITSIIIFPINNELRIFCSITGENLFTLDLEDYIYFLSEYDQISNAIYVSYGNRIAKIILDKR